MRIIYSIIPVLLASAFLPGLRAADWDQARPLLEKYCLDCHGGQSVKADLDYTLFLENEDMFRQDVDLLEEMEFMIAENEMPPPTADVYPNAEERKALLNWNLKLIDEAAHAIPNDPGVVFMPKLTRTSYNRVLSQLAGHEIEPGNVLAREAPSGMGFTNVGEAHTMEANQLQKYLMAATEAVSYLRISPVDGMEWSPRKLNDLSSPKVARDYYFGRLVAWHEQITNAYANEPDQWFRKEGIGHAEYWYQLWRWENKDALGINAAEMEDLVEDSSLDINGVILEKWQAFFDQSKIDDPVFEEIRTTWHALPGPSEIKPEAARQRLVDLEAWYRRMIDYSGWEPDIELKSDRVFGGGEIRGLQKEGVYRFRYDFSKLDKGQSHETLYLTLAKGAKSKGDVYVLLDNGHLLYGDDLEKEAEHRVSWQNSGVTISDTEGTSLSRSQLVDALINEDASILIKTPAILVLKVSAQADGIDLDYVIDKEKSPNGTIQHWLDLELLENQCPSEAQLAQLSQEDRRKAEKLLAEMAEYDHLLLKIARSQIREFAEISWRRELTSAELDRLMAFYIDSRLQGAPYDMAAKQSVRAILCSPHFIYRYQPGRNSEEPYPIEAHGLADRLAAVFWDGIPDKQLLAKARDGSLTDPEVLADEASRMLVDEKAYAMEKMATVDEGDGTTLLDNTMLTFGSNMMDGNRHYSAAFPVVLAGGANCDIKGGRVLDFRGAPVEQRRLMNLHLATAQRMGANLDAFGNSTFSIENLGSSS